MVKPTCQNTQNHTKCKLYLNNNIIVHGSETHEQRRPLLLFFLLLPPLSFLSNQSSTKRPPPSNLFLLLYDPISLSTQGRCKTKKKKYQYLSFNFSLFYYFPPNLSAEAKNNNTSQTLIRSSPLPRFSPVSLRSPRSIPFSARIRLLFPLLFFRFLIARIHRAFET